MAAYSEIPRFSGMLMPTTVRTRARRDLLAALDDGDSASGDSAAVQARSPDGR
ncbi:MULTISPECIES: hypothetical protein [unclassified Corynebacterium]|uniref:hypothetical protein n=1 Tax=unclassified Corynebacterium TaxID=2624378 RepID=UPI00143C2934|nr:MULTISPECIES: hypothetical protein [unclassified Corynebacterium]